MLKRDVKRSIKKQYLSYIFCGIYSIQYAVRRLKELTRDERVQRSTKGKSWWNFLQRVLLCTTGVHDQLGDIYPQEYLRVFWIK